MFASLRPALRLAAPLRRPFSTTLPNLRVNGPLPTFQPTSNPELDKLLSHIRDDLFVPAHLLVRHKHLIYRPKNHALLEAEPVDIEISGQTVRLTPKTENPTVRLKVFSDALKLMQTPSDLDAIPSLLLGFSQLKRQPRERQFEHMTRLIIFQDRPDLLWKIAQDANRPHGFKFTEATSRDFLRGFWIRAHHPNRKESLKALSRAQKVQGFLGSPDAEYKLRQSDRLAKDPINLAILLDMQCMACERFNDGKDFVVKEHPQGLVYTGVSQLKKALESKPLWEKARIVELSLDTKGLAAVKHAYTDWWFVVQALKKADKIVEGKNMKKWIAEQIVSIETVVDKWEAWLKKHDKFSGKLPFAFQEAAERVGEKEDKEEAEQDFVTDEYAEEEEAEEAEEAEETEKKA